MSSSAPRLLPLLLALATLVAAALAASLFPDMKKILLLIPFALLALTLAGCTTTVAAKLAKMPDGSFASARFTESGNFLNTTIELTNVVKDNGLFTAEKIHFESTNPSPIVGKITFDAVGYTAQLTAAEKKKILPPLTPANSTAVPPAAFTGTISVLPPKMQNAAPADPAPVTATVPAVTGTPDPK